MEAVAVEETTVVAAEGMLTIAAEKMTAVRKNGIRKKVSGMRNEENWDTDGSEQDPADWKTWDREPENDWGRDPETAGEDDWSRDPETAGENDWSRDPETSGTDDWGHDPETAEWDSRGCDPETSERDSRGCDQAPDESNNRNRKRAPEKKKRRRFGWLIPAVLLVVFVFSFASFMREFLTYQQAKNEYKELGKYIEVIPEGEEAPSDAEAEESTPEAPEEDEKEQYQYPNLQIDYDGLTATNSEFVGVIYIPVLNLTYPIAQSTGNDKYLHTTFEGTRNASGCIFLDCAASKDFSDSNSFIFGHNMKNGTMFGSLKQFLQKEELCDEDPYIYIYQKDQVLVYRIFAYYTIPVRDDVYDDFSGDDGYDAYVADAGKHSVYHSSQDEKIDWSSRPNLLTLSTCYATGHVNNFIVQAALVENVKQ